jgi:hypothetical protein
VAHVDDLYLQTDAQKRSKSLIHVVCRGKHGSGPMDMQLRRDARGWTLSRRPWKVILHALP